MKRKSLLICLVIGLVNAMLLVGLPLRADAASPGRLDISFSDDGKVLTNVIGDDLASDLVIQPDGKIVVVGQVNTGSGTAGINFLVLRYNPDGSLDPFFGSGGIVITDFGNFDVAKGVALQADGKIVVVGYGIIAGSLDFMMARYNPNGSLDTTFDTDGKVITDFASTSDNCESVAIQADGKIVAGGYTNLVGNSDFALARYNHNGTLDTTFSGDGKFTLDYAGLSNTAVDIKLQFDGKIVGVGQSNFLDFIIYRVTATGTADTTFGAGGIVTTNISNTDYASSIVIQPDGKIIAAGSSESNTVSSMARYEINGLPDTSFDTDGKLLVDLNPSLGEVFRDIDLQSDGKIVAALDAEPGGVLLGANAVRFNANGSRDISFGKNGIATTSTQTNENVRAAALSGDNLVVLGDSLDISLVQFNVNTEPTQSTDFDGDGFSDYVIFRPSTANWFILRSKDSTVQILLFGATGDVPLDGDFDGDGKSDMAIFRPSVYEWWFQKSSDNGVFAARFGESGDKPVPSDADKDGKTDFVYWRPSNGNWFVLRSSDGFASFFAFPFGSTGDIPVGTAIFP